MQTGVESSGGVCSVPPPIPPDDSRAWYAPAVCAQYEVHPGVVVTIRQRDGKPTYEVREPGLTGREQGLLDRISDRFSEAEPPPTRDGVIERLERGFRPTYEQRVGELLSSATWRLEYHALARVRGLGGLTPYALDGRLTERAVVDGELVVGTAEYAGVETGTRIEDRERCQCLLSERHRRYTVSFLGYEIPVVVSREQDREGPFRMRYTVCEPPLFSGDAELLRRCKERLWGTDVSVDRDRVSFVRDRAERLLSRFLRAQATETRMDSLRHRFRGALTAWGLLDPPERADSDRVNDLLYYVLRDFIGYERLTIPIHDDRLEDIEVNRVGERIKVVPRGSDGRLPANLRFESEGTLNNVVTQLAASDGVELNASRPSAKVNLDPVGSTDETIRCAVALGTISEDGPHVSIRKQRSSPLTPVELVHNGSIPTALVALLWLVFEHHGVVLFSGPTGVGKTTLMNAHVPFIPHDDRPISIDEGSREVRLPHETGISLRTRDHHARDKRVTMADLMTESNYLNPDVEIIAEINTPESFATFGESLSTGHGIIGTTHAETIERLTNRLIEQGLPPHLLAEIDLVVFPRHVDDERYVGKLIEPVPEPESVDTTIERDGVAVGYNTILRRTPEGGFDHPDLGDSEPAELRLFERLADRSDRSVETIERSFHRKHRFVESLVEEGVTEMDALFERLAGFDSGDRG